MAELKVTIDRNGSFTPRQLQLSTGDLVSFVSNEEDAVLCFDSDGVFGEARYEIPEGEFVNLTVQAGAPQAFEFIARMGDLDARCRGARDRTGSGGGGTVGGDPD